MSRTQSRRSISISGPLYDRLKAYCQKHDRSMSGIVTETLSGFLPAATPEEDLVVDWEGAPPIPPAEPTADDLFEEAFDEGASVTRPPPSRPERSRRGHNPF
jgi:hypothetical protein